MQRSILYIRTQLKELYPESEIQSLIYLILERVAGMNRLQILVSKNTIFSDIRYHEIENIVKRLVQQEPIQYIFGEATFCSLPFRVDARVLIPRPETEELVDWILTDNQQTAATSLLDIGTGSGCIPITIAVNRAHWQVAAIDVSADALAVAEQNAKAHHVAVECMQADILAQPMLHRKWDIIVSNPPYICDAEQEEMLPNVLENEPHLALFVPDNDPLLFYRAIANFAQHHLTNGGVLYFEINRAFGKQTVEMLAQRQFEQIELRKDLSGNDRMVKAVLNRC